MYGAQQTLDYSDEPVIIVHVSQSRERCLEAALRDFSQQLQIRLKLILGWITFAAWCILGCASSF